MNAEQARAWATAHKKELGAGGVVVVLLLGLRARKSKAGDTVNGTAATSPAYAGAAQQATGGSYGGAYDSTSSDVYNALQPQLESVSSGLDELRKLFGNAAPTPVPAAPDTTAIPNPIIDNTGNIPSWVTNPPASAPAPATATAVTAAPAVVPPRPAATPRPAVVASPNYKNWTTDGKTSIDTFLKNNKMTRAGFDALNPALASAKGSTVLAPKHSIRYT